MSKGGWREFDNSSISRPSKAKTVLDKAELNVRVQRLRGGKGGKTVTVIQGLQLNDSDAKIFLKRLKTHCGAGGSMKDNLLEIQGDQVFVLLELLKKEGYRPKQAGG